MIDLGALRCIERVDGSHSGITKGERKRIAEAIMAPTLAYPSQLRLFDLVESDPMVCAQANRRAGKTEGIGRYTLAQAIMRDDWTCVIASSTLKAPSKNWIDRKGRPSALRLLRDHDLLQVGRAASQYVKIKRSQGSVVSIAFPMWGSEISVIDVGRADLIEKHDGQTAHLWWFDEAQNITVLQQVLVDLVTPTLQDHAGGIVLTGTPGIEIDSYFGQVAQGKADGWVRAHLAGWQNPRYGDTFAERWAHIHRTYLTPARSAYMLTADDLEWLRGLDETTVEQIRGGEESSAVTERLDELSPSLLREFFGRWVGDYGTLVFPWTDDVYWADAEPGITGAIEVLPKVAGAWKLVLIHDVGFKNWSAWVAMVWAHHHPTAYVIHSEKAKKQDDDQTFARTADLLVEAKEAGFEVLACVVDMGGMRMGTKTSWDRQFRARLNIPAVLPRKGHDKDQRIKAMSLDISRHHFKVARGSAIDIEGRHLRWHQDRAGQVDKEREVTINGKTIIPGNDALDGAMYGLEYSAAHWQRPKPVPVVMTDEQRLKYHFPDIIAV